MVEDLQPKPGILNFSPGVEGVNTIIGPAFDPLAGYPAQGTQATNNQVPNPQLWDIFPEFLHLYSMPTAPVYVFPRNSQQNLSDDSLHVSGAGRYQEPITSRRYTGHYYNDNQPGPSTLQYTTEVEQQDNYNYTELLNSESDNPIPTLRENSMPKADPILEARPAPIVVAPLPKADTVTKAASKKKGRQKEGKKITPAVNSSLALEVPGGFVCHFHDCKRHTRPFSKKHNLTQHRRNVHKESIPKTKYRFGEPNPDDNRLTQRNGRRNVARQS